jgi:hypothetical protein
MKKDLLSLDNVAIHYFVSLRAKVTEKEVAIPKKK